MITSCGRCSHSDNCVCFCCSSYSVLKEKGVKYPADWGRECCQGPLWPACGANNSADPSRSLRLWPQTLTDEAVPRMYTGVVKHIEVPKRCLMFITPIFLTTRTVIYYNIIMNLRPQNLTFS